MTVFVAISGNAGDHRGVLPNIRSGCPRCPFSSKNGHQFVSFPSAGVSVQSWECLSSDDNERSAFCQIPVRIIGAPKGQLAGKDHSLVLQGPRPFSCAAHFNAMAIFAGSCTVVLAVRIRQRMGSSGTRRPGPTATAVPLPGNELQVVLVPHLCHCSSRAI